MNYGEAGLFALTKTANSVSTNYRDKTSISKFGRFWKVLVN
jgi:hypothetical protein